MLLQFGNHWINLALLTFVEAQEDPQGTILSYELHFSGSESFFIKSPDEVKTLTQALNGLKFGVGVAKPPKPTAGD